jgi:hypothetical protein
MVILDIKITNFLLKEDLAKKFKILNAEYIGNV